MIGLQFSGLMIVPLGISYFLAQATTPSHDAAQTFFNLASLIIGGLATLALPIMTRYFQNMKIQMKQEVEDVKKEMPAKGITDSIQTEITGLHDRVDKLVDSLFSAQEERDKARETLEKSTNAFTSTIEKVRGELEEERQSTAILSRALDDNQIQTDQMERKIEGLLGMNQLADMIIDRLEMSFTNRIIPQIIQSVESVTKLVITADGEINAK